MNALVGFRPTGKLHLGHWFNEMYGTGYQLPEAIIPKINDVRDLRNPDLKMSKSNPSEYGILYLVSGD